MPSRAGIHTIVLLLAVSLSIDASADERRRDGLSNLKAHLKRVVSASELVSLVGLEISYDEGKNIENGRANLLDSVRLINLEVSEDMMNSLAYRYHLLTLAERARDEHGRFLDGLWSAWRSNTDHPRIEEWIKANQPAHIQLMESVSEYDIAFVDFLSVAQRRIDECADRETAAPQ